MTSVSIILSLLGILSLITVRGHIRSGTKHSVNVISPMDGDKKYQEILSVYHYVKQVTVGSLMPITMTKDLYVTTKFPLGKHGWVFKNVPFMVYRDPAPGRVALNSYWNAKSRTQILSTEESTGGSIHVLFKKQGVLGYVMKVGRAPVYQYWTGITNIVVGVVGVGENYFYTRYLWEMSNHNIRDTLATVGQHGYRYEGIGFYAVYFENEQVTVYQYWNSDNLDHFYTPSADEIGTTKTGETGAFGYVSEGIAFTLFHYPALGRVPVYRYYNQASQDHLYTTNVDEIGTVTTGQTGKFDYKCEGIIGYGLVSGQWPVYRYHNSGSRDNFYTQNTATMQDGPWQTYTYQGVSFYSSSPPPGVPSPEI